MPKLAQQTLPAASGMDSTSDPVALPMVRAQRIQNVLADRAGQLRAVPPPKIVHTFNGSVDGIGWRYSADGLSDELLVVSDGVLFAATVNSNVWPPTISAFVGKGIGFAIGQRARFGAYDTEVIIVQEGGIQPKRYDGVGVYQLGISPPTTAPGVTAGIPSGGATGNKTGTMEYAYTYADSRFRESDLSPARSVTSSAQANFITVDYGDDPQVQYIFLYVRPSGSTNYYRVTTLEKPVDFFEDNVLNTTIITAGTQGPIQGQYAIPSPASVVAVNKNHVFLNDVTNPDILQVNNLYAPTQWSNVVIDGVDAGERIQVMTDQADFIVALVPFGSLLGIWKRRGFYQLWGDTTQDFTLRKVHERGCYAVSSASRCDNVLAFLAEDAVYFASYDNGFRLEKLSKELERIIQTIQTEVGGTESLVDAVGWYYLNSYFLHFRGTVYVYSFDTQGWTTLEPEGELTSSIVAVPPKGLSVTFVGYEDGRVGYYDTFSTNQFVSNIIVKTRSFDAEQPLRVRRKHARRFLQMGNGQDIQGTVSFYADNNLIETHNVYGPSARQKDVLVWQECGRNVFGRSMWVEMNISGTGVILNECRLDYTAID